MSFSDSFAAIRLVPMLDAPADVCIEVDGKNVFACSEVLSAQSTVWASSLSGEWKETNGSMECEDSDGEAGSSSKRRKKSGRNGSHVVRETAMHLVEITEYSYEVVRACIFWVMTDQIAFEGSTHPFGSNPRFPKPVPALDVYRFAHFYDIEKLSEAALQEIKSKFTPATIMGQLFEERVGDYAEVKKVMMDYVKGSWEQVQAQPEYDTVLKHMMGGSASPHESAIMAELLLHNKTLVSKASLSNRFEQQNRAHYTSSFAMTRPSGVGSFAAAMAQPTRPIDLFGNMPQRHG